VEIDRLEDVVRRRPRDQRAIVGVSSASTASIVLRVEQLFGDARPVDRCHHTAS
jgi:hypothetical protein